MDYRSLIKNNQNRSISDERSYNKSREQLKRALDRQQDYELYKNTQSLIDDSARNVERTSYNVDRQLRNTIGDLYNPEYKLSEDQLEEARREQKKQYEEEVSLYFQDITDEGKDRYKNKLMEQGWNEEDAKLLTEHKFSEIDAFQNERPKLVDAINQFAINMNTSQIEAFRGLIQRANDIQNNIALYKEHINDLQELDRVQAQLNNIQNQISATTDQNLKNNLLAQSKQLLEHRSQLDVKLMDSNIRNAVKNINGLRTSPDDLVYLAEYGLDNVINFLGKFANITGDVLGIRDEIKDIKHEAWEIDPLYKQYTLGGGDYTNIYTGSLSKQEALNKLSKSLDNLQNKVSEKTKEWQTGVDNNMKDMEDYRVSDYWAYKEATTELSLWNPKSWLQRLPGMMGSSAGSWHKQLASLGLAFIPGTGWARVPKALSIFDLNYSAGRDENNMEVGMAVKERLQEQLKQQNKYDDIISEGRKKLRNSQNLTDDQIFDAFVDRKFSTNNKEVNEALSDFAKSTINLYNRDMVATTTDAALNTMLEVLPLGYAAKMSKYISNSKVGKVFTGADAAFMRGMAGGPIAAALNVPLHAALRPIENAAGRVIKDIGNKMRNTSRLFGNSKLETINNYRKALRTNTHLQYTKDIFGRIVQANISEGIEEGKQYRNSEKYKNGDFDRPEDGLVDIIVDDFLSFSKTAQVMLGIPFGAVPEDDYQMSQEILGGMLLGGSHVAVATGVQSINPWVHELKATDVVMNNMMMDKADKIDSFNKGIVYANASKNQADVQYMQKAFERLKELNGQNRQEDGSLPIDDALIDEENKRFKRVISVARDNTTKLQAEDQGINIDSEKYNRFVSAKSILLDELNDSATRLKSVEQDLNSAKQDTLNKEYLKELQNESLSTNQVDLINNGGEYNNALAELAAALTYRDQLQAAIKVNEYNPSKKTLQQLNFILDKLNKHIESWSKALYDSFGETLGEEINNSSDVDYYVINEEAHSLLKDAYLKRFKALSDYDLINAELEALVGVPVVVTKDGNVPLQEYMDKKYSEYEEGKDNIYATTMLDLLKNRPKKSKFGKIFNKNKKHADYIIYENSDANNILDSFESVIKNDNEFLQAMLDMQEEASGVNKEEGVEKIPEETPQIEQEEAVSEPESVERLEPIQQSTTPVEEPTTQPEQNQVSENLEEIGVPQQELEPEPENVPIIEQPSVEQPSQPTQEVSEEKPTEVQEDYNFEVTPSQQRIIDTLNAQIELNKTRVLKLKDGETKGSGKYFTTPFDYFIQTDGGVRRASRVHSILPKSWEKYKTEKQLYDNLYNRLFSVYKDTDKLLDEIKKLQREYNNEDLYPYIKYIEDKNIDSEQELLTVIDHISEILSNSKVSVSINIGNIFDSLIRAYFQLNNPIFEGNQLADYINEQENKRYIELFSSPEVFEKFISTLNEIYIQYAKLKWKIISEPITFVADFKNVGKVAGETDLLAVDEIGDVHIIDIKTTFLKKLSRDVDVTSNFLIDLNERFTDKLSKLTEADFTKGSNKKGLSKAARDIINEARSIANDNNITLVFDENKAFFAKKGDKFLQKYHYRQNMSQFEDYQNQQTAYQALIHNDLYGVRVRSMELMRFGVEYGNLRASNALNIYLPIHDIKYAGREMLMISSKMMHILNDDIIQENDVSFVNPTVVEKLISNATQLLNDVKQTINDIQSGNYSSDIREYVVDLMGDISTLEDIYDNQDLLYKSLPENIDSVMTDVQDITDALEEVRSKMNEEQRSALEKLNSGNSAQRQIAGVGVRSKRANQDDYTLNRLDYRVVSRIPDLSDATNHPAFITDAKWKIYAEHGKYLYADITFAGKTWNHINIESNDPNNSLLNRVLDLQKDNPDKTVVPIEIDRTNGRIASLPNDRYQSLLNTDLLLTFDLYDLEYNSSFGKIGHVDKGNVKTFSISSDTQNPTIYSYPTDGSIPIPEDGTIIWLKEQKRNELATNPIIPVTLRMQKLTDSDIDFILQCILNPDKLYKPHTISTPSGQISIDATNYQLLSLLINYITDPNQLTNEVSILRDQQNPFVVTVRSIDTVYTKGLNLKNQTDVNVLRGILQSLSVRANRSISTTRIGSDENVKLPFKNLREFWKKHPEIPSIKVSDSLQFDLQDFLPHTSESTGKKYNGLSGFGWHVKRGILQTQYNGLLHANVNISQVGLAENQNVKEGLREVISKPEEDIDREDIDVLFRLRTKEDEKLPTASIQELRSIVEGLLGETVTIEFAEDLSKVIQGAPASAIGACLADAIYLSSESAHRGVAYHEAFHRVLELLVDKKTLDKLYDIYAKRLGLDLISDYTGINHRIVAEYLADEFERYSLNRDEKIKPKKLGILGRMWARLYNFFKGFGKFNDRHLYRLFLNIHGGVYNGVKSKDASRIQRFKDLYKALYLKINDTPFEHILDLKMYDDLRKTVVYCITVGQEKDIFGSNIQNFEISKEAFQRGIDILYKQKYDILGRSSEQKSAGQLAMQELLDKFEIISDDIASDISYQFNADYEAKFEQENAEKAEGDVGDVMGSSIGEHTKATYEFDKFEKASAIVKYFFSTIHRYEFTYNDGRVKRRLKLNDLGLPTFEDARMVYKTILNNFWDITSIDEFMRRLMLKQRPLYYSIYKKLEKIRNSNTVDSEAFLAQLFINIKSNKFPFKMIKQDRNGNLRLVSVDQQYNARNYITIWSNTLSKGGTKLFKLNRNGKLEYSNLPNAKTIVKGIHDLYDSLEVKDGITYGGVFQMFSDEAIKNKNIYFRTKVYDTENSTKDHQKYKTILINDVTDKNNIQIIKGKIVESLNWLGINISLDEFDFMLDSKYGTIDYSAVKQMLESTAIEDSMSSFIRLLTLLIDHPEHVDSNVYSKIAFVRNLANWKYSYVHMQHQTMARTVNDNRVNEVGENNYLSDRTLDINRRGSKYQELKGYSYNYIDLGEDMFGNSQAHGSYIIKQLEKDPNLRLELIPFGGFRTNQKSDQGADYFEIQHSEDYISKLIMLTEGNVVLPTLESKKTYFYISGVNLPGFNYSSIDLPYENYIIEPDNEHKIRSYYSIVQDPSVVDQFISYALCEYQSIKETEAELNELKKLGDPSQFVENYHTFEQGAKFSSLLGIYEDVRDEKSGVIVKENYVPFNTKSEDSISDNIINAETKFFNLDLDHQRIIIARLLQKQLDNELQKCVKMGLIRKHNTFGCPYYNYANKHLPAEPIDKIYKALLSKHENPGATLQSQLRSLAIVLYLNDMSNKHMMSIQEFERLYSGNPAFYSWKYNKDGSLKDRTTDEIKRFGGVDSTGQNNYLELKDIPKKYLDSFGNFTGKYKCSIVNDKKLDSPQYQVIYDLMYESHLKNTILNNLDQINEARKDNGEYEFAVDKIINGTTVEEAEKIISDFNGDLLTILKRQVKTAANKYKNINTTDGCTYITDDMCEMLLRMNGKYTSDIKEAFDTLRNTKEQDVLKKSSAYQKVITTVIGTQKYTAFGHVKDGAKLVPYFLKTALAPIFPAIATGRLRNIYEAMKKQGVDMMPFNSSMKVGGKGAQDVDFDQYSKEEGDGLPLFEDAFKFNILELDFSELRKQLNTDAHEVVDQMRAGTQMQKVALQNIIEDHYYTRPDGTGVIGSNLLSSIMNNIAQISIAGQNKVKSEYLDENEQPDIVKFSETLRKMMSDSGTDVNTSDAIKLKPVETSEGTIYKFNMPLQALSSLSSIQSKVISGINKDVIDVNLTGSAFIQRPAFALDDMPLISTKLLQKDVPTLNNGEKLELVNKHGAMDCVLSIDYFLRQKTSDGKPLIPESPVKDSKGRIVWYTDENGKQHMRTRPKSFDEARQWLINHGIIGKDTKPQIISYRIPTQGNSSVNALTCVDVIPIVNDTIILPDEITAQTGSDFDVDKMFLSSYTYLRYRTKDDNGKSVDVVTSNHYDSNKSEQSIHFYKNALIADYITLFTSTIDSYNKYRPVDVDTSLLTTIVDELESKQKQVEKPYDFYTLGLQTDRKNDYISGKKGVAVFALANANQALTKAFHVTWKRGENIMTQLGLDRLDKSTGIDGESIFAYLSALITAHVDIAKDPFIKKLNVDQFTYDLVNLLIRTGFGKNTFYFITQPVIKKLTDNYNDLQSKYLVKDDEKKERKKQQTSDLEETYVTSNYKTSLELIKKGKPSGLYDQYRKLIESDALKTISQNPNVSKVKIDAEDVSVDEVQCLVYLMYLEFKPYAQALSDFVNVTKIDTKKHGKNLTEQLVYLEKFRNLFGSKDSLFDVSSLTRLKDMSFIGYKTEDTIKLTKDVMSPYTIEAQEKFQDAVKLVYKQLFGNTKFIRPKIATKISNILLSKLKSGFFDIYVADKVDTYKHDLIKESSEDVKFNITDNLNVLEITSNTKHDVSSYVGGTISYKYTDKNDGKVKYFTLNIIGVDGNNIVVDKKFPKTKVGLDGELNGGKNTIYDRLIDLQIKIRTLDEYKDMLTVDGDIQNYLLRILTSDATFTDKGEIIKFVTLFDPISDDKTNSNFIIEAWDELLHDEDHPEIQKFAEDLVVYSFITSGDTIGFTKFFNYVPNSWRIESGYANYMENLSLDNIDVVDAIINNWFSADLFKSYNMYNFTEWGYLFIAERQNKNGEMKRLFTGNDFPKFIKVNDSLYACVKEVVRDGRFIVPVYERIVQKGNLFDNRYLLTEYSSNKIDYKSNPRIDSLVDSYLSMFKTNEDVDLDPDYDDYIPEDSSFDVNDTRAQNEDNKFDVSTISDKTSSFGVEIIKGSREMKAGAASWQSQNPQGIVAYRKYSDNPKTYTPATVNEGWIGNPFSVQVRGEDTVQKFYDWLVTGNNFGETRANEEFRQAIVEKILNTPDNSPILYYTELNRPSHATVIGYLVNNKQLLQSPINNTTVLVYDNTINQQEDNDQKFDPQNVEDKVLTSLMGVSKQPEVQKPDEDGKIQGKLGVDKSQLIALLGNTMYTADVQSVAEKELVQNAFDAVKIAKSEGKIQKGKIDVYMDKNERTVTIQDNGSGMTPEIVQKAFFTIGGSYKGDNVDNRLKSGGLGLAKMAFLFTADYIELSTVKDGKLTYTKATPEQIQNDDFVITVSDTNQSNGTRVTVKIPENYIDQSGESRHISFYTYGRGFFSNHMIGDVEVNRYTDGKLDWTEDFNKIPEGYVMIGTATSDFGDIEIYKDFTNKTSTVEVLISGLYQFQTFNRSNGDHYRTIVNILPTVGTKSETYPINNQREGFRATVEPEIKDMMFFLTKLDNMFERKRLKSSFGKSFNMDANSLSTIEKTKTTSTKELIDQVLQDVRSKYKTDKEKATDKSKEDKGSFGLLLSVLRKEREKSEKIRSSSFNAPSGVLDEDVFNQYVDTSNLNIKKPIFHNNTDFTPSKSTTEFLTKIGEKLIQLRDSFLQLNTTGITYNNLVNNMRSQYWGISVDKKYNGINVNPQFFNFLAINPINMVNALLQFSGVTDNFVYQLQELIFHNILHEVTHNTHGWHDENFTIQFQYTYSEFANLGQGLLQWKQEVRDIIQQYLKPLIEDAEKYKNAENTGDSLEGRNQRVSESEESSVRNNESTVDRRSDQGILQDSIEKFIKNLGQSRIINDSDILKQSSNTSIHENC